MVGWPHAVGAQTDAQSDSALAIGDEGAAVLNAQELLNQYLALSISTLPLISEDGLFGSETKNAVEEYEAASSRTVDGVLTVAERGALRIEVEALEELVPHLERGDDGATVETWQGELNNWARLTSYLLPIDDDGIFGINTETATRAFEGSADLQVDGIVEPRDRRVMREALADLRSNAGDLPPFDFGATGSLVQTAQSLINEYIAFADLDISLVPDDGLYGRDTRSAVRVFEERQGLNIDGVLTRGDFDDLRLAVAALEAAAPSSVISEGDTGSVVLIWQRQLGEWLTLSEISIDPGEDGIFGELTTRGTIAFERRVGVQVDGVVEPEDRAAMRDDLRRLREIALDSLVEGADSLGELIQADDFTNRDAAILRLYFVFFNRSPDLGGAKYWIDRGNDDATIDAIIRFFASSPEFVATNGTTDDAAFVTILYRNALEREADPAGLNYWVTQIERKALSRQQVAAHFAYSPEFVAEHPLNGK